MSKIKWINIIILFALFIGCIPNKNNKKEETSKIKIQNSEASNEYIKDLASHTWYLSSYSVGDNNTRTNQLPITLKFEENGQFKANFCNAINGNYTYNPEKGIITLSNFTRTKKMCEEKLLITTENLFQSDTYTISITKGILEMDKNNLYFSFYRNAGNENQMSEEWDNYDKQPIYIVLFKEKTSLDEVKAILKKYKLKEKNLYDMGDNFRGFAAPIPPSILQQIKKEPTVLTVEKDQIIKLDDPKKELIRDCPEELIVNKMPSIKSKTNEPSEYYIYKGERKEIKDFDTEWVKINCKIKTTEVH